MAAARNTNAAVGETVVQKDACAGAGCQVGPGLRGGQEAEGGSSQINGSQTGNGCALGRLGAANAAPG